MILTIITIIIPLCLVGRMVTGRGVNNTNTLMPDTNTSTNNNNNDTNNNNNHNNNNTPLPCWSNGDGPGAAS